ncbi:MAG TPA: hypothetical protein VGP69_04605 [Gaiellaceae bacterium]|jgi:hypothetical protein|nr:hypothetical protein [Gaiellaceae bacterium]
MRRILTLVGAIATLAAGVTAAVALGAGTSSHDTSTGTTTAAAGGATTTTAQDTSTGTTTAVTPAATTTTAPDTSTGTTTAAAGGATTTTASSKVWVCHHTGSWKHPYHLIHISTHALPAHMRHGDVTPGADNSCPTTQPAGTKTHGRGNGQSNNAKTKDDNPGEGDDETETNDD